MKKRILEILFFYACVIAFLFQAYAIYSLVMMLWKVVDAREVPGLFQFLLPGLMMLGAMAVFNIGKLSLWNSMTDVERAENNIEVSYIMLRVENFFSRKTY